MKNIHILPTDKPSRLHFNEFEELVFTPKYKKLDGVNIYITSDEEEPYPYALHIKKQEVLKINGIGENSKELFHDKGFNYQYECKKIILTTDIDLIKDGVQAIDDEFLEWFVKNPSCEKVNIEKVGGKYFSNRTIGVISYEIIIPIEKPKQETLEEAINNEINNIDINSSNLENIAKYNRISGTLLSELKKSMANIAKWQQERMYSEEDMEDYSNYCWKLSNDNRYKTPLSPKEWFEQFKNK